MTWVVVTDPIPGGATILGSGLGRDSQIATQGEKRDAAAAGRRSRSAASRPSAATTSTCPRACVVEYTVRLNNVGDFALPPSRVEAMYAPEMFGEIAECAGEGGGVRR